MANSPQARKRARQAEKRRQHNAGLRSMVRTYIKNTYKAVEAGDKELAQAAFAKMIPVIDNMVHRGMLHKNKASRHKSRLNAHIKAMGQAS